MMNFKFWIYVSSANQIPNDYNDKFNLIIPDYLQKIITYDGEYYVSLPYVCRNQDEEYIKKLLSEIDTDSKAKGIFVHNTEELYIIRSSNFSKEVMLGPGMYIFNNASRDVLMKDAQKFVLPYELSGHEIEDIKSDDSIFTVYGRTPLMISANCIRKTNSICKHGTGEPFGYITDRKNMDLPVLFQCKSCYNVIYNAVPCSYHEFLNDFSLTEDLLLYFTDESPLDVKKILDFYYGTVNGDDVQCPISDFSKAYYKHGVE